MEKKRHKEIWRINYRFYDPTNKDDTGKVKPYQVRFSVDMNYAKDLDERRTIARRLIKDELHRLKEQNYNPFTRTIDAPLETDYEIRPDAPLPEALEQARQKLEVVPEMMKDIKSAQRTMEKAIKQLRFDSLEVSKVSRRHLLAIMGRCGEINKRWSANRHNKYRSYLVMLFKVLVKYEAVIANPALGLDIRQTIKRIRETLTYEQRLSVREHLEKQHPAFFMFVNLFFHSGARVTELLQQTTETVKLDRQKFKAVVKKGKKWVEVDRTIKDVAMPYWKYFLDQAKPGDFLFGSGFKPAKHAMKSGRSIGDWWKKLVKWPVEKGGLGIQVDFYSLKHLNTAETVDLLGNDVGTKVAAHQNAHTSDAMVISIYDVHRKDRVHNTIKKLSNGF